MSGVATITHGRLPTRAPEVVMSPRLGYLAAGIAERGFVALPSEVGPDLRSEAEQGVAEMERLCEPASPEVIEQWLDLVALSVGQNAPEPRMRRAFLGLVLSTSGGLPRACWTAQTRADFARSRAERGGFWPSDGEIDAFLRPIGNGLLAQLRALRAIRDKGMQPRSHEETGAEMSAEQREAVLREFGAKWAAMKADRIAEDDERFGATPQAPLRDVTLKGDALRAFRARCGNPVPVPGPTPAADGWTAPEPAAGSPTDRTRSVPTSTPAYRAPEPDSERPAARAFPPAMREPAGDDGLDELLPEGAL